MIQEMMAWYWESLLVGYVKAGLIGWTVWFVVAFMYVLTSFKLNLSLYQDEEEKGGKKWTLRGILRLVLWPYGMLYCTHRMISYVNHKISGKE